MTNEHFSDSEQSTVLEAVEIAESIQKRALIHQGRDLVDVLSSIEDKHRVIEETYPHTCDALKGYSKNNSDSKRWNTLYQCPFNLYSMNSTWDHLARLMIDKPSPGPLGSQNNPILLSAENGHFHATTISASDGSYAILFEDEIFKLGRFMAGAMNTLLGLNMSEYSSKMMHPSYVDACFVRKEGLDALFTYFLEVVQNPDSDAVRPKINLFPDDKSPYTSRLFFGFLTFVMGHELAHLEINEITSKNPERASDLLARRDGQIAAGQWMKFYSSILKQPDDERFNTVFNHQQGEEVLSDYYSFRYSYIPFCADIDSEELFSNVVGSLLPLMVLDLLECSIRLLVGGKDMAVADLWFHHSTADDLCLRGAHPSPSSRIAYILSVIPQIKPTHLPHEKIVRGYLHNIYCKMRVNWMHWAEQVDEHQLGADKVHPRWSELIHTHDPYGGSEEYEKYNTTHAPRYEGAWDTPTGPQPVNYD